MNSNMVIHIKERYRRFRAWQESPFHYAMQEGEAHCCRNCGHEFVGNFCPCCGQKATLGEVNWPSVRENVMEVWGVGTRSMSYTLWQLFLRPGYLIRDYIEGKRQVSFPPVKMLLIVGVICMLLTNLIEPFVQEEVTQEESTGMDFFQWAEANQGWAMLLTCSVMILPTWILFRHAPRCSAHSLPAGFFIQVFLSTLTLIICTLSELLSPILVMVPIYYVVAYRQLFGYGLWGTLWRMAVCVMAVVLVAISIAFFVADLSQLEVDKGLPVWQIRVIVVVQLVIYAAAILGIGDAIGRRTREKRLKKNQS